MAARTRQKCFLMLSAVRIYYLIPDTLVVSSDADFLFDGKPRLYTFFISSGVGKSSMILRHVDKMYDRFLSPTIGASYFSSSIKVEGLKVHLQIWDTAGQERFKALAPMFYRNANGAFLVYDITQPETFENIKKWVTELKCTAENCLVLHVIGCKTDRSSERQVFTDEAIVYANSIGASYHECSSLKDEGIDEIFENAATEFIKLSTTDAHGNTGTISLQKSNILEGDVVRSKCC